MTSHVVGRTARLLGEQTWLLLAVLVPVLHVAGGAPELAVLLVAGVATLVAAAAPTLVPAPPRIAPAARRRLLLRLAPPTSRIPDPVHHPLSPRAPGLV